ncbi:MAG: protein kinase [Vicinamibacterales bacterium]
MSSTVQPGTRIGHYEILAAIGKGGMGEVWKARDTRLRRLVAIKTLPGALAQEPARLARLEREAEILATLNHHHIATIHGLEQLHGTSFLVMELVEGDTLEDRLLRGPIPIEEALTLALQIAQALEAAHDKGIIHRDLKPANVKVTPDRRIKVLDFGIAKALAASSDGETEVMQTETGVVIGTPAYMSPEQARGETVGVPSDIWSFGALLYQMLTAISPFTRKTGADTIASVLESQPDYAALPPETPLLIRRLVQRCLEKDASRRLQHMGEVRVLVEEALASLGADPLGASAPASKGWGPWVAVGIMAATLAGVLIWSWSNRSAADTTVSPVHVSMPFEGRPLPYPFGTRNLAISLDGSSIAMVTNHGLQIRRVDQKDGVIVPTGAASNPFFSPDGEWVGLFLATALAKVPARGGKPITLAAVTDRPAGGTWRADGTIVFATSEALYEISADGGEPKVIARPDRDRKETLYAWPHFLPGGGSILFTVVSEAETTAPQTVLLDLKTLERKTLLAGSSAIHVPGGQLLYMADSTLTAVGFDAASGALTGKPVSFPELEIAVAEDNGGATFAISDTGTLIFTAPARQTLRTLEWIDRHGQREALPFEAQNYAYAMVSPDGTLVAADRTTNGNRDIWILDLKRLTQTRLTDGPTEDMLPVWSADGQRIFFASRRSGNFDIYSQAADGASSAKLEFAGPEFQAPNAPTPDGTRLIVLDRYKDLAVLDFAKPDRLELLLPGNFDDRLGQVSPDGRWIAYESNESGNQFEIVLRSFPNVQERRETISINGGRYPRWGPRGSDELFYLRPDGALMAASVKLSPTLVLGPTTKLFDWQTPPPGVSGLLFDVAPDGRFLMTRATSSDPERRTHVSLVLNWLARLRDPRP